MNKKLFVLFLLFGILLGICAGRKLFTTEKRVRERQNTICQEWGGKSDSFIDNGVEVFFCYKEIKND